MKAPRTGNPGKQNRGNLPNKSRQADIFPMEIPRPQYSLFFWPVSGLQAQAKKPEGSVRLPMLLHSGVVGRSVQ